MVFSVISLPLLLLEHRAIRPSTVPLLSLITTYFVGSSIITHLPKSSIPSWLCSCFLFSLGIKTYSLLEKHSDPLSFLLWGFSV